MQNDENSGKGVHLNTNSGQFNHLSQVTNQYLAKVSAPLREGVELRDCPGCYIESVVDAEICRNDNCNTNFKHYRNRMACERLAAELEGIERRQTRMIPWLIGGAICGLLLIAFGLWMFGMAVLAATAFLFMALQETVRARELRAGLNFLQLEMW